MPDVSIVIRATDRFSDAMRTMSNSGRAFDRDLAGMQRHLDALNNTRATLRVDTDRARQELRRAQRQYLELGDAASEAELRTRNANFENARRNLDLVRREAAEVERQMIRTSRSMSEADNQAASGDGIHSRGRRSDGIQSFSSGLRNAGLFNEFSQSISELSSVAISSAIGQPMANAISDIAAGALSGAAAGSLLGPHGALVGAGIGAVSGGISGASKIFQAKDDAFKSYVQESFDEQINAQEASRVAGSTIAGTREQTQMAFAQKLGSDAAADDYLAQVKTMAKNTNYGYDEITGYSKLLLNTYDTSKTLDVLQKLSDATAGLNLNSADVNMFIAGLSRMRTTGKATQEYLNYFSERGVDVYQALSNSTGADKSSISEMITHGDISGEHAAESILTYIDQTYGGLSEKLASTYDAMVDNLADYQADMDAAMGEGYNEGRKAGIQAQMDWMSGESGAAVEEANKAIGAWKAEHSIMVENLTRRVLSVSHTITILRCCTKVKECKPLLRRAALIATISPLSFPATISPSEKMQTSTVLHLPFYKKWNWLR